MKQNTLKLIEKHLEKARKKHPNFTFSHWQTVSVAAEELGEFAQAVNDYLAAGPTPEADKCFKKAQSEAADLIAVMVRFLEGD